MNSLIKKFLAGLKKDAKGTIVKSILYALRAVGSFIADGFYLLMRGILFLMPSRTLTRLKHSLSPTIRLDYARGSIRLQADSLFDFYRARACEKEPETVEWIETYLKKGDVFFDIGANIGAYSLVACAHCEGEITIIAFEPSFSSFHQLCRNIITNKFQKSITPYQIALTKSAGLVSFNYHSLEAGSADHQLGDNASNTTEPFVYTQQLLAFNMDYLIEKLGFPIPNHIKLDVDGAEVDVLHGAAEMLQNNKLRSILVEVREIDGMSDQVDEILRNAGFQLVCRTNRGTSPTWNCIYARDHLEQPGSQTLKGTK
jgi:FkbM family methyltransferase